MKSLLQHWWRRDVGTITVDWVVVSAAVVGLGLATIAAVRSGSNGNFQAGHAGISTASILPVAHTPEGEGMVAWSLLTMSEPMFDAHLSFFAEVDQRTRDLYYADYASMVTAMIAAQDVHSAGLYLDAMAAVLRATANAGAVIHTEGPTITDLGTRFNDMLG
ncbi:hypothetical protein LCM17_16840 [Cereibacter sphaeroides]|nr:hypothetical protein [Cereibacter sphaeroides]